MNYFFSSFRSLACDRVVVWKRMAALHRAVMCGLAFMVVVTSNGCRPSSMRDEASRFADESIPVITPAAFEEAVNRDRITVVKFGATWCGPCVKVDRELVRLADEMGDQIDVLKIDVDQNPDLASRYEVTSIPRILVLKNGKVLGDEIGFQSKDDLASWIREVSL